MENLKIDLKTCLGQLNERFERDVETERDSHGPEGISADPTYLDLHFAASQDKYYSVLFEGHLNEQWQGVAPERRGELFFRVLGAHYFTYDHTRITKIIGSAATQTATAGGAIGSEADPAAVNQLLMFAYRQIFTEKFTLNAWLLRTWMSERSSRKPRIFIEVMSSSEEEKAVAGGEALSWHAEAASSIRLEPRLAERIMSQEFCELVLEEVRKLARSRPETRN